MSFYTICS